MQLSSKELNKLEKLFTLGLNVESDLYINKRLLYKIYKQGVDFKTKEENINIIMNLQHIDNCIWPKDKIYIDDKFSGIVLDYKKGFKNLAEVYGNFDLKKAINMGNQLSIALKQIHDNGLIYGDIHGDNIITDCNNSYFCDLDGMKMNIANKERLPLFTIMYNDRSPAILDNQTTDNIKLLMHILSAIYGYDFEYLLRTRGTEYMQKLVQNLNLDNSLKYMMMEAFNIGSECLYFYKYSKELSKCEDMINYDKKVIANKVKFLLY